MTTHTIPLSHNKPPLNANQKLHWARRAEIVKQLRTEAFVRARSQKIGTHDHITVQLVYKPKRNLRRDAGNLMPTHKAILDGLVDAGIVPDDTPQYVTEMMPRIEPADGKGTMWVEITTDDV